MREAVLYLIEHRPSRALSACCSLIRLQRQEWNHKRIYRVYKARRLNLRRAAKRRLPKHERIALYVSLLPESVF